MMSKCVVERCAVNRGRMEEAKAVKSRMIWVACLPPKAMVTGRASEGQDRLSRALLFHHAWFLWLPVVT